MHKSWIALAGMVAGMAMLAGCSDSTIDGGTDNTGSGQAVSLASSADVLRELGNLGSTLELMVSSVAIAPSDGGSSSTSVAGLRARLRAAQAPRTAVNVSCSGGGTDSRTTSSNVSHSFTYFSFTGPMNDQLDVYSNCSEITENNSTELLNGSVDTGTSSDSGWAYTVLGSGQTSAHVILSDDSGNSLDRGLLGTVEGQATSQSSEDLRAVLQTTGVVKDGGSNSQWQVSLGQTGTPYELTITSTGLDFNGPYSYSASATGCSGGDLDVTTPNALVLTNNGDDSTVFTGGTVTLSSGGKSVTVSFAQDGSATMSGNVSGTLASTDVSNALLGSTCVQLGAD